MSESPSGTVPPSEFYFDVRNLGGGEAREKLDYMSRDLESEREKGRERVPIYNRAGRPMSDDERETFLERAQRHDYAQRWQVSPPNGDDLTRDELRRETRRLADDYTRDKSSSRVAYAVHTDQDGPNHAHVLLTGNRHELRMDREEIDNMRTKAHERMTANERYRERRQEQEQEHEQEQERDRGRGLGLGR